MYHYRLPSPSLVEDYLLKKENNLILALRKRALPRSQRTDGFSLIKAEAFWLERFWRVYSLCPPEEDKPSLPLAIHHFYIWRDFQEIPIKRCESEMIADKLNRQLQRTPPKPTLERTEVFDGHLPSYHTRTILKNQVVPPFPFLINK